MLLKGLTLSNIRSYGDGETSIDLLPGLTLFEGDIGSGKSTILAAIEFGLFGLGDVEAKHLLRHGAKRGRVRVSFEVGGRQYSVSRTLVKSGRGIQQEECTLEGEGVGGTYSPSELKPKVLEILGFNEKPDTKSTSRIFRYAVYTPQESMKEVLSMGEAQRLDTLRRAFNIEKYSWAVANAEDSVLREWLRGRLEVLKGPVAGLPAKRAELDQKLSSLAALQSDVTRLQAAEGAAVADARSAGDKVEFFRPKRLAVTELRGQIPLLEKELEAAGGRLAKAKEDEGALRREIKEAADAEASLTQLRPAYDEYVALRERMKVLAQAHAEHEKLSRELPEIRGSIALERRGIEKEIESLESLTASPSELAESLEATEARLRELEARKSEIDGQVRGLEEGEAALKELEKEAARLEAEIASSRREIKKSEEEWGKIELIGVHAPCPLCKQELTEEHYRQVGQEYASRLSSARSGIEAAGAALQATRSKIEAAMRGSEALRRLRSESGEVGVSIGRTGEELKELRERASKMETAAAQLAERRRKLAEGSFAAPEKESLAKVEARIEELRPKVEEHETAKARLEELEEGGVVTEFARLEPLAERRVELEKRLERAFIDLDDAATQAKEKGEELAAKRSTLRELEPLLVELDRAEARLKETQERVLKASSELSAAKATEGEMTKAAESLKAEVGSLETKEREFLADEQLRNWVRELFIPSVSSIETQVLASVNERFNLLFQEWFSELMETGDISVRIDDSFTPLVEQDGYEIDAASLSGGERTSLALAYRLALNTMVKQQSSSEGGLLILDEPTDGFSSAQLLRLRDVLQETGCEQVIMVSHEKELESFVDNIYEVSRTEGESVVRKASR